MVKREAIVKLSTERLEKIRSETNTSIDKYMSLVQKELSMGDLLDVDAVSRYSETIKSLGSNKSVIEDILYSRSKGE